MPTITGTRGVDRLTGSSGNDVISGLNGEDFIRGLGGNDQIFGGDEFGDPGLGYGDGIDGGAGDDVINGGNGHNYLIGGAGSDTITGGNGRDVLVGAGVLTATDIIHPADFWDPAIPGLPIHLTLSPTTELSIVFMAAKIPTLFSSDLGISQTAGRTVGQEICSMSACRRCARALRLT